MSDRINHDLMRYSNILSVFTCVLNNGPISKREVQRKTGHSWGSISNIITELERKGLLVSKGQKDEPYPPGRIPSIYDINCSDNYIIGVDFSLEGITGVITDFKCNIKYSFRQPVIKLSRDSIISQIISTITQLKNELRDKNIMGIGIAFPGTVDKKSGIALHLSQIPDFKPINFNEILGEEFGIPIAVQRDPDCMAEAEKLIGLAQNLTDCIFIRVSYGIGMSILSDNKILSGGNNCIGQFSHMTVIEDGSLCTCGKHGCLKTTSSITAILSIAEECIKKNESPMLKKLTGGDKPSLMQLAYAARSGDECANNIFHKAANYVGIAIANVAAILDPQIIILSGELTHFDDVFVKYVRKSAEKNAWPRTKINIACSSLQSEAAAIGAAAQILTKIKNGEIHIY